jgi:hypothetical protein
MRPEPARSCAKCHLRIAAYDLQTLNNKTAYHQHCFLILVREEGDREKARGAEPRLAEAARRVSA